MLIAPKRNNENNFFYFLCVSENFFKKLENFLVCKDT